MQRLIQNAFAISRALWRTNPKTASRTNGLGASFSGTYAFEACAHGRHPQAHHVSGFERHAGLRRKNDPAPRWLIWLGWALPIAVFGDILENVATWAAITCIHLEWRAVAILAGVLMSIFTAAKLAGMIGTVCVILLPTRKAVQRTDTQP